jgi:Fe2+ or Zn2+ uptake regulation protein
MDPRTIYRNVNRLLGCGILHRPSHGLIEIAPPLKQHHHHITCPQCGKKNGFLDTALEAHLEKIMAQRRRQLLSHQIELIAVCGQCSTQT